MNIKIYGASLTAMHSDLLAVLSAFPGKPKKGKSAYTLVPQMNAIEAACRIHKEHLKTVLMSHQSVIEDVDPEFLHSFRVAVRKSRTGLAKLKGVFSPSIVAQFKQKLRYIQQITNGTRDLDVYIQRFEKYKKMLPSEMHPALETFRFFLKRKRTFVFEQMKEKLNEESFHNSLQEWQYILDKHDDADIRGIKAHINAKDLADESIVSAYSRIVKNGSKIKDNSPPQMLHKLRIDCKNLRYLLEFFADFYSEKHVKPFINKLKKLQNTLGDYQDMHVQSEAVYSFMQEMRSEGNSESTVIVLENLKNELIKNMKSARKHFHNDFNSFSEIRIHKFFR
jgi:CHAD domain-containing protein